MLLQNLISIEESILLWIQNNMRNEIATPIFVAITTLGNGGFIWIIGSLLLLISKQTRRIGILSLIALIFSVLIDNILLKNLVARTRPYEVIPQLTSLIGVQNDFSFPSGHTGSSFAAAVVMCLELPKKYGIMALCLAFLIGFSRLYVGVHYPSDVIAGALLGTGIAFFTCWFGTKCSLF